MATWINTPASISLVDELNEAFDGRDKTSDGTVGDLAHQGSVSDHNPDETGNTGGKEDSDTVNEVHARDADIDVRRNGWSMERVVQIILGRCRTGVEKRLDYIIFNRRIWRRSNGWVQELYYGSNPHDHHAHFSFRYGSGSTTANPENITSGWGILDAIAAEERDKAKENSVSAQDVRDYFNSANQAIQFPQAAATNSTNRADRDALARIVRFALGLDFATGEQTAENLPPAQFAQIDVDLTSIEDKIDQVLANQQGQQ